jgi:O-antigen/teichoic acid export membrane protein
VVAVAGPLGPPRPLAGLLWLRQHIWLGTGLGLDSVLSMGAGQASVYVLGAVVGLPAAGALRGAESLYGPVRTVVLGTMAVSLPEATARARVEVTAMSRYALRLTGAVMAVALAGVVSLSFVPDVIGLKLLGDTWQQAATVMSPVGLVGVGLAATVGPRIGLRVLQRTGAVLRLRAVTSVVLIAGGVGGAIAGGLTGAAYGLAASQAAAACWSWVVYRREMFAG